MNSRVVALIAFVATAVAFFAFGGYGWVTGEGNVEEVLTETGVLGPVIFVLVMWCTQPFGVPGVVYMVPAGIVWPYPLAIALSWIGNMGASFIAFAFARWFARDWVKARIPQRMHRYDDYLERGGVMPIVGLRVVFGQLPPADWLLGVSKVSQRNFVIGTGIGIVPGVFLFVLLGGGLFDLLVDMPRSARLISIGVIAALLIARRVWKRRRRAATDDADSGAEAV
ncbi:MAG: VTT domain-containing protein [Acidimicrobiia bacterium]|nr:VTT domain-containing protein [Acidimicrobiia bacterium]